MTAKFKYLAVLLLFFACKQEGQESSSPPSLYKSPTIVELNTNQGYALNQMNGDTLKPFISKQGDTLLTGSPITFEGKVVPYDSISPPLAFPILPSHFDTVLVNKGIAPPVDLKKVKLDLGTLKSKPFVLSAIGDTNHYKLSSIGDTIYTGVEIPVTGKVVNVKMKRATSTLPTRFKENASRDIQFLDVDQGLPSSYVYSIDRDSRGNFWLGFDMAGAIRYDGNSYIQLKKQSGLTGSFIKQIHEDRSGNVWFISSENGINRYDGNQITQFTEKDGLLSNKVTSVLEDQSGNLWFGTEKGVTRYDGETFLHITDNEGLSARHILSISEDKKGRIWLGSLASGVYVFDGDGFKNINLDMGLGNNRVSGLFSDDKGKMWIATYGGGANMYDGKYLRQYTQADGLSYNYLFNVTQDSKGNIWFSTNGGGASMFDGERFKNLSTEDGLSSNYVRMIEEDNYGNLWMATDGGGVNIYKPNSFKIYSNSLGVEDEYITSIEEDNRGDLWLGTFFEGIIRFDEDRFIRLHNQDALKYTRIWDIKSLDEDIWLGVHELGAFKLSGDTLYNYQEDQGLNGATIIFIERDSKGNLWFGSSGSGLTKFDGKNYTHYDRSHGLIASSVLCMKEDIKGNLWFGTYGGGVFKLREDSITHYTEREGLSSNTVWAIEEDQDHNLWFGTNGGGVSLFDGEKFSYYTESVGLSNNTTWSLTRDSTSSIWVGTEKGLNEISKSNSTGGQTADHHKRSVKQYYKNDGLLGLDFVANSVKLDSRNRIWWGTGRTLTSLNLNSRNEKLSIPKLSFTDIDINGNFVDYRNPDQKIKSAAKFDRVKDFLNYPLGLSLPYEYNHLTFYFTATDWIAPHQIRYSYKLSTKNNGWSRPSSENKADYRNIPHGTHTLQVKAIGASQEWSETLEYTFTILPPWYHTWWARTIYFFLGILLIWGYANWRTTALKKRQFQLEYEINEATQEISAQKQEAEKQRDVIEEAHTEIKDSIQYAKRIQSAILPPSKLFKTYLPNSFVLYQPKDVVAGDFYWLEKRDDKVLFAAADCTGHGVPGAMVSVVCNNALNRSVREYGETDPAKILDQTRDIVIEEFEKSDEDVKDGMDIALCTLKDMRLEYAGAHNPLWIIRKGEITESELGSPERAKVHKFDEHYFAEIKADKQPIGKYDQPTSYTMHAISLKTGDRIYIFSDGLADQFGGELGKKLKTINVKRFLISIQNHNMEDQATLLEKHFKEWKGDLQQVDDVCFIGVEV